MLMFHSFDHENIEFFSMFSFNVSMFFKSSFYSPHKIIQSNVEKSLLKNELNLTFLSRGLILRVAARLNEKLSEVFLVNLSLIFLGQFSLSPDL